MSVAEPLAALGLTDNPFAVGALPNFYFVGGQRRFLLQQAVHGLYIARSIVLLCGERGAGKTHLLIALQGELEGLVDRCAITASVLMDGGAIRRELAELCRLPVDSAVDNETLASALSRQTPLDAEPLPVALLIDDAHELAVQTLAELQQLVSSTRGRVRLLLAGEPTLVSAWQQLPVAAAELLELQPLDLQESADYLQTRLQAAGWRGALPLTPEQMQKLYRAGAGCIGRLNELAPAALAGASSSGESVAAAGVRRLPWQWIAAVAGVLLLTVAGLSLIDSEPESVSTGALPAGERTTVALPLSVEPDAAVAADPADALVPEEHAPARRVSVLAPLPDATAPRQTEVGPTAASAVARSETAPPDAAPISSKVSVPAPKASVPAVDTKAVAAAPVAVQPKAPAAAEPFVVAKPAIAAAAQTTPHRFDEQQLLALAPDAVLLQLMASGSHEASKAFMRANAATTPALLFEARRSGKPWFVLVTGPYADRAAALAAVSSLPEPLRALKPWPRSAASVQSDIRAAHSGR